MDEHQQHLLLVGLSTVIVLGIAAQWLAWRAKVPAILLLLAFGAVVGPGTERWFGHKWFDPDALLGPLLPPLVSLSVAIILFEGGLTLKLAELSHVGRVVRNLVTVGAATSLVVTALAAWGVLGLPWQLAVLLGAILVVTGPTVIGPLLRHVRPVGRVTPTLRWEGIVIDPLGAVLAVLVFNAVRTGHPVTTASAEVAVTVLKTAGTGLAVGLAAAGLLVLLLWRYWIADFLENPFTLMLVVAAYTGAELWQADSGLLAVTVMGIALANQRLAPFKHIHEFKESLSVLLVSALFILLASRLDVAQVRSLGWRTVVFLAVLILFGRPLSVLASTVRSGMTWREKLFLSCMAPRGIVAAAVSGLFAQRLRAAGVAGADRLVPITFAVIVSTVMFYGLSAVPLARWLHLARRGPAGFLIVGASPLARTIADALREAEQQVVLVDTNPQHVAAARMAGFDAMLQSAVSEQATDRLEGTGIGTLLALTPNEEVNTLAAVHFSRVFGRSCVYQLAADAPKAGRGRVSHELRGRVLFDATLNYAALADRASNGLVKRTLLTATFRMEQFRNLYGPSAIPLFLINETGDWLVVTDDHTLSPQVGQTLISLVDAKVVAANRGAREAN